MVRTTEDIVSPDPGVRLVVFGEAALGLYHDPADPVGYERSVAEPIPGAATDSLGALARRLRLHLAVGLIERSGDTLYNALVVIAPDGRIAGKHRKMLLFALDEANGIRKAAPNAQVVRIGELRVGLAICSDANSR